ncbi:MAG TPA: hypothetical protein VGG06_31795 [Thermoanaerobaculia bacterium]
MHGIHDQLFKGLAVAFPGDLVTLLLPEVAARIDLGHLRFESKEFFLDTPTGRRRFPDLVSRARGRSDPDDESVVHVEHFSRYRVACRSRVWDYQRLLGIRYGLPVHTGVVYGRGGPAGLVENVDGELSYGRMISTFHYNSLGLSGASAAEYLARPEPLAWSLAVLMRPEGFGGRGDLAMACLRRIASAGGLDDARRHLLLNFVRTYVKLDERAAREYERLLHEPRNQEIEAMVMTWAEEVEAKGREEGLQKGLETGLKKGLMKGLKKGRLEGMQDLVLHLLRQRFGAPSAKVRRRVGAITSSRELTRLAERLVQVDSPEELGLT